MTSQDTQPEALYAAREPVFPRRVKGTFRTLKWWLMAVTLGIYYLTPWLRWDRGPSLPDQAVLIDMANRRFYFFMVEIWSHEFYFVAGLLIMAGLGLFLFTSAAGRVWCGYACPQTVWTDLYILVERWVEGDRNARLRLHRQKMNFEKFRKRMMKWALWLLIGVATGGAWVFYFTDAPTLLLDLLALDAHPIAWLTILILTLTTFLFGGFFREQVCIYACPWPRIQAAMMDEDTITVAYRDWRGEPRGKLRAGQANPTQGDCIDCMACVNVCPMGIDIRNGQQLACITCALCIDACDEVMDKIGKPRGLISYLALTDEVAERAGAHPKSVWKHVFRVRTILYTALWSAVGVALIVALFIRSDIDVNVSPVRNPTFVTLSDGSIRNTYDLRLRNKLGDDMYFSIALTSEADLKLALEG
ncbi:MAG TPA: cytochrome c oxidase accessory protein CcoG, partial [Paracoccaceae bacterium]